MEDRMLKKIPRILNAEILNVLMLMGHGDDLLICDVNHPAATIASETVWGKVIDLSGTDIPTGLAAILELMPVDTFVGEPVKRMQVVGDPGRTLPIFDKVQSVVNAAEGRSVGIEALERFAFYEAAKSAFAVIRTSDPGPYGCFIIRKGVIDFA
jgi:L-fucose mutarotase